MNVVLALIATYLPLTALSLWWWDRLGRQPNAKSRATISLAMALTCWGLLIFVLGWLRLFEKPPLLAISAASGALLVTRLRAARRTRPAPGLIHVSEPLHLAVLSLWLLALVAAIIGVARWPYGGDEVEYKWAAPLAWAHAGRFVEVPFRLSNGFNLGEYLFTPSAVFDSLSAARSIGVLLAAGIGLATWSLAEWGGSDHGWVAASGVVLAPVVLLGTRNVGSDLLPAFLLGAALLAGLTMKGRMASGVVVILTGGAVFAKVIVIPVAGVVVLATAWWRRRPLSRSTIGRMAVTAIVLASGVAAAVAVNVVHTTALTGHPFTTKVKSIYPSDDPMVASGAAAGRIPNAKDIALLPANPFITGVVGQREPYGGRTGLLMLIGLPVVMASAWLTRHRPHHRLMLLVVSGWASYLVLAPVFIKTRFLNFSWMCFYAAIGVTITRISRSPKQWARWTPCACLAIAAVSAADPIRVLFRAL